MTLYTFEELIDNPRDDEIGKKAQSLVEMTGMGARVPEGFVIGVDGLKRFWDRNNLSTSVKRVTDLSNADEVSAREVIETLKNEILSGTFDDSFIQDLDIKLNEYSCQQFAIRSSGNCEDLDDASFAGLYETKLNVIGLHNICDAIKECWSSLFSERVIQYCLNKEIELSQMTMSLIVQRMIPSEKSGVLFSVDPLTGNDKHMLVEACFGLGEALVGGEVTPDQYVYDWYNKESVSETINEKAISLVAINEKPFVKKVELSKIDALKKVISDEQLAALVDSAVDIQVHYGHPVDIEWAYCKGIMYIVQSRPITQINYSGIQGEWSTADFKDGGVSSSVCSPFMWSLYDYIWESELPKYIDSVKLMGEEPVSLWGDMFFGRPYWNVGAVKEGLKKLPGYVERSFDEDLGVAVSYEGDGYVTKTSIRSIVAGLRALMAMNKGFSRAQEKWKGFRDTQTNRLDALKSLDVKSFTQKELFEFYEEFINEEFFNSEANYFNHIYDNSNVATLFKESIKNVKSDIGFIDLVSGLDDVSHLALNYGIWNLSRAILSDSDSLHYWRASNVSEIVAAASLGEVNNNFSMLRELIEDNCFHSTRELDITVPRYGEDPSFIVESVKSNLSLDDSYDPKIIATKQKEKYNAAFDKFMQDIPFYRRGSVTKSLLRLREFLWWREEYRDLSTHFYYYVRSYTLMLVPYFKKWKIINVEGDLFFLTKDDVINVLNGQMSHEEAADIIRRNRQYYLSFRNFDNPSEIGGKYSFAGSAVVPSSDSGMVGIPCSPGVVRGRVRIIKDIFDADRLQKGDILITKFTDPGWTPKFGIISAVATETGGVLSHAAVISREYGIPAVLAIPGLTTMLSDGQWISINGSTGVIESIEEVEETS